MFTKLHRAYAVTGVAAASLVLLASPALAHVTVQGPGATQGGYAKVTFRVPTEKDIPTTKLQVVFPTDAPLANVGVKPHAGWRYVVAKGKPATPLKDDMGNGIHSVVLSITWTTTSGGIKPGEFDEFDVSAGPLPKLDKMVFKALQTYRDGSVVRWIEPRIDGGKEPDHPAPVLKLAAATESTSSSASPSASPSVVPSGSAVAVDVSPAVAETDAASKPLAYTGVGLGAVALLIALGGLVRARGVVRT